MKLIDWNVNAQNKKLILGMEFIKTLNPDLVMLQEFPHHQLKQLTIIFDEYHLNSCLDFKSTVGAENDLLLVTLTRLKPEAKNIIIYTKEPPDSFLKKYVYQMLKKQKEEFTALEVKINKELYIINMHLPTACGSMKRLHFLEKILLKQEIYSRVILAGDLNISSGKLFNFLSGWARGFKKYDYQVNEREIADNLFAKYHLNNIFSGKNTTIIPSVLGKTQFDHLLVKGIEVKTHNIYSSFGSDHKIIAIEI